MDDTVNSDIAYTYIRGIFISQDFHQPDSNLVFYTIAINNSACSRQEGKFGFYRPNITTTKISAGKIASRQFSISNVKFQLAYNKSLANTNCAQEEKIPMQCRLFTHFGYYNIHTKIVCRYETL